MGIGVELNLELAKEAGLDVTHGIVINHQGKLLTPIFMLGGRRLPSHTVFMFTVMGLCAKPSYHHSKSHA